MHGGAAGAFAQVVQTGDQHGVVEVVADALVGKHAQFHFVGVGQCRRVKLVVGCGGFHADPVAATVMVGQGVAQVLGGHASGQQVQVQRQLNQHALAEVAHRRDKQRTALQPGVFHDLGNVLVLQAQAIEFKRRGFAFFMGFDQAASAPRITTDGGQGERKVARQQAGVHQRANQRNGAGGVTARVADAARLHHGLALASGQFWKTKHPARRRAVRAGGVNDFGARPAGGFGQLVHHGHRFDGGFVVQTQDDQVHTGHERTFGAGVLAQLGRNADDLDAGHGCQPFAYEQAGGAGFAINKYFVHGEKKQWT